MKYYLLGKWSVHTLCLIMNTFEGSGFAWYYSEGGGKEVSAKDGQGHHSSRKKQKNKPVPVN